MNEFNSKILFNYLPSNMSSTFNKRPQICVSIKQKGVLISISKAVLFIDDVEIIPIIKKDIISYTPSLDMPYGKHYIKVSIWDTNRNIYEYSWFFWIENNTSQYNFYYGVPHAHTSYSDGNNTPTEAYEYARDNGIDFLIVTDHLGKLIKSNINNDEKILYEGKLYPKWEMLKIEEDAINKKYTNFLALIGFEANIENFGHMNIINSSSIPNKRKMTVEEFYTWLCIQEDILIVAINHPKLPSEELPYSSKIDAFVNLIEVGNGSPPHKYRRSEEAYFKTLDDGWHIGAINGQDNHTDNWGIPNNLTVIIADKLNIDSVISALNLRRVYSTETRTLKLTVQANGYWMGSIIDLKENEILNFKITAEDAVNPISKIQIISNGGNILQEKLFDNAIKVEWDLLLPVKIESSWYVVKVFHSNELISLSSPVFVQAIPNIYENIL
ncbi:hypothetical protein CPJCM30710_22000 [Clostridium polyendosporum]|uniref:Polymerase/histidinol phosphatase N-terminal domain-containing protein n=1 Tax=Clostridium polyendosporum TaxID=69208 RepID=A0A919VET9_9CLOT|nr:CehA/McbA family metallohydrolase [Clostridium polyendosporum]GIM29534.1 hypothetical protein CPJCM30710_22000 [Clostridium polyendosporum]